MSSRDDDDDDDARETRRRPWVPLEGSDRPTQADGAGGAAGAGLAGELWAGRYRLVRLLGHGGMGEVFEAIDTRKNEQRVALKRMFSTDPKGLVSLKREYRRMEGKGHPNLVTLYELGVHDHHPFIVMEYVQGQHFYGALGGAHPPDLARLRMLTRQLSLGVLELHDQGLIHRDLKGGNVLVTPEDRLVILDFGLVNEIERRTLFTSSLGKVEGTPLYMAPEQTAGLPGPPSDWYAVGVMLFHAVTGAYPIWGSPGELLLKGEVEPPRASALAPAVPPDLDELIARLLRSEPSERASGLDVLAWCESAPGQTPRVERKRPPAVPRLLVGRERQQAALAEALARFRKRVPLRVDITGSSGTGKTALMRHFLEPLRRDSGFVVLEGRCYEHDSVPYKGFDGVMDSLGRYLRWLPRAQAEPLLGGSFRALCRLFPTLGQARSYDGADTILRGLGLDEPELDPQETRLRAFQALRNLLHRIAVGTRLVLAVDDLQWGDVDSARLLTELMAPPGAPPLLFVCAYRSEDAEASPMLRELAAVQAMRSNPHDVVLVHTEPLAPAPARELALRLLGGQGTDRARAEAIALEAHGNPMLIESIVRYLGDAAGAERATRVTEIRPAVSLEHLVRLRLDELEPDASRLLDTVAAAGQPTALELLARAARIERDPRHVTAELRVRHFVRTTRSDEGDDLLEIYHQRLGRAVLHRLTGGELAERHHHFAEALAAAGGEPERLAYHWFAAGERGLASEAAIEAGEMALRVCAFDRAATLFRLALQCRPGDGGLRRKLATALLSAGRGAEAAPILLEAAEKASRASAARRLRREAGEYFMIEGQLERGQAVLRPLMTELGVTPAGPDNAVQQRLAGALSTLVRRGLAWTERSEVELSSGDIERHDLCWTLCKGFLLHDVRRGGLFAAEAAVLALDLGEPRRIGRSLALTGVIALERGEASGATWLKEADRVAKKIGDRHAQAFIALCRGVVHRGRGAWSQARGDLEFGLQQLPAGTAWEHALAAGSLLASLEALGDMAMLALRSQQMVQVAQNLGSKRTHCLALTYSAVTALAADDVPRCRQRLAEALEVLRGEEYQIAHLYALKVAVECDIYVGDVATAWRRICEQWPAIENSTLLDTGLRRFVATSLRARAGLALWASGTAEFAHIPAVVEQDVAQVERERAEHAQPLGKVLRAGLSMLRGEVNVAQRHLKAAIVGFDGAGMTLHATCARRAAARHDRNGGMLELAERLIRMQGVARPDRWTAVLAPGLE